jgi:prephenate dehydrogenase/chorismate mutase/prephenate dehydrogenase
MQILVIGSKGRLGRTLMRIFPDAIGLDMENISLLEPELKKADFAFLAVPLEATLDILHSFPYYNGFIDLTSIKSPLNEFYGHIISLHPMFGPQSYENNKSIIFIDDISVPDSLEKVIKLFQGYNIIPMNAKEHDSLMGELLVKPYILSYISEVVDTDIVTKSYTKFLEIAKIKDSENPGVLLDTIKWNPDSERIITDMEKRLQTLKKLIGYR